jgi:hypothetical protein
LEHFSGPVNADLEEKEGELPEADKIRVSSAGQEKQEDRTSRNWYATASATKDGEPGIGSHLLRYFPTVTVSTAVVSLVE